MNQEHPDISITTLGYAAEPSMQAAGMFPGCKNEIAGEMATGWKASDVADKGDDRSGTQQADSGNGTQVVDDRIIFSQDPEITFDVADTTFEIFDLYA